MISPNEHRLEGLSADNLLAFLALLGALRALQVSAQEWRPRVRWSLEQPPLRPVLALREKVEQRALCETLAAGVGRLAEAHTFQGKTDLNHRPEEARTV